MNKVAELYDKFVTKYGQDTMRVPVMDIEPGQAPPVVEIPSTPKRPTINDTPSYDDVNIKSPRQIAADKAVQIVIARCEEVEMFSKVELAHFRKLLTTRGPRPAFKEILHQIQKRMFAAETCLQIAKNFSAYIQ